MHNTTPLASIHTIVWDIQALFEPKLDVLSPAVSKGPTRRITVHSTATEEKGTKCQTKLLLNTELWSSQRAIATYGYHRFKYIVLNGDAESVAIQPRKLMTCELC